MTREEREYLDSYDYTRYDRPSLAADMAVFSIMRIIERTRSKS